MPAFHTRTIAWPLVTRKLLIVLQTASDGSLQQTPQQTPARGRDSRTWYLAYTDGVKSVLAGYWQSAIDSLEASKRARGAPKPGRRVPFYGDVYNDYLPDYYLGTAYLNLKRFADADRAFESVRASGVIAPRDREYAQLDASAKTAKASAQLAQAPQPPAGWRFGFVASSAPSTATSTSAGNPGRQCRSAARHDTAPQSSRECFVASALVRFLAADGRDGDARDSLSAPP